MTFTYPATGSSHPSSLPAPSSGNQDLTTTTSITARPRPASPSKIHCGASTHCSSCLPGVSSCGRVSGKQALLPPPQLLILFPSTSHSSAHTHHTVIHCFPLLSHQSISFLRAGKLFHSLLHPPSLELWLAVQALGECLAFGITDPPPAHFSGLCPATGAAGRGLGTEAIGHPEPSEACGSALGSSLQLPGRRDPGFVGSAGEPPPSC